MYARNASEAKYPHLWRGLVGAWSPVLNPRGGKLLDRSGYGNHGTLTMGGTGSSTWNPDNIQLATAGSGNYNYFDAPGVARNRPTSEITLAAWVVRVDTPVVGTIMINRSGNTEESGATLFFYDTLWRFWGTTDGLAWQWQLASTSATAGVLYHLVGTFRSGSQIFYVNGISVASAANTGTIYYESNRNWRIGGDDNQNGLGGKLYDSLLYDRALYPAEIQQLYSLGPGGWAKRRQWSVPISEQAVVAAGRSGDLLLLGVGT